MTDNILVIIYRMTTIYLDSVNGDNNTGIINNINKPFRTIEYILSNFNPEYTIYFLVGTYIINDINIPKGVKLYLDNDVLITDNNVDKNIFNGYLHIDGYGIFIKSGKGYIFNTSYQDSYIKCSNIYINTNGQIVSYNNSNNTLIINILNSDDVINSNKYLINILGGNNTINIEYTYSNSLIFNILSGNNNITTGCIYQYANCPCICFKQADKNNVTNFKFNRIEAFYTIASNIIYLSQIHGFNQINIFGDTILSENDVDNVCGIYANNLYDSMDITINNITISGDSYGIKIKNSTSVLNRIILNCQNITANNSLYVDCTDARISGFINECNSIHSSGNTDLRINIITGKSVSDNMPLAITVCKGFSRFIVNEINGRLVGHNSDIYLKFKDWTTNSDYTSALISGFNSVVLDGEHFNYTDLVEDSFISNNVQNINATIKYLDITSYYGWNFNNAKFKFITLTFHDTIDTYSYLFLNSNRQVTGNIVVV